MLEGIPPEFLMLIAGAFVLGWLVAKTGSALSARQKAKVRDPKDDRIRSLEAEHRIAVTVAEKAKESCETLMKDLEAAKKGVADREAALDEQMNVIAQLRSELSDRATESVRSEVKLREVETELEVSRASTDLIATGVLDYSFTPDEDDEEASIFKAAT